MKQDSFTINDLLTFVMRGLTYALPVAVLLAVLVYLFMSREEALYEATATLLATEPNRSLQNNALSAPAIEASTYVTVVLSDPVLREALENQGLTNIDQATLSAFAKQVRTEILGSRNDVSHLVQVSFSDSSPQGAADGANALAAALMNWDRRRASDALDLRVATLEQQLADLDDSIESLRLLGDLASQQELEGRTLLRTQQQEELFYARALRSSTTGLLSSVQPATVPGEPVSPRPARDAALAAIFGLFLVYGVLLFRNVLSTRLATPQAIRAETGLPVLAELGPPTRGQGALERRLDRNAVGFLRTQLVFAGGEETRPTFLITSPGAKHGKTSVAASLAESFARSDQRTLLIDGDLRRPKLAAIYGLNPAKDEELQTHLAQSPESHSMQISPSTVTLESGTALDVIPIFTPSEAGLEVFSKRFQEHLAKWQTLYDVILIDAPPVLTTSDTLVLAKLATSTLLVVNVRETRRPEVVEASERLRSVAVPVAGVVVTRSEDSKRAGSRPVVGKPTLVSGSS
jgi:Mrp family chromosome partitioning ATPase